MGVTGSFWSTGNKESDKRMEHLIVKGLWSYETAMKPYFDLVEHTGGGIFINSKEYLINGELALVLFSDDIVVIGKGLDGKHFMSKEVYCSSEVQDDNDSGNGEISPLWEENQFQLLSLDFDSDTTDMTTLEPTAFFNSLPSDIQEDIKQRWLIMLNYQE